MSERFYINYRDYDENDFDIYKMDMEDVDSTNSLIDQALIAVPSNNDERELLKEYLDILQQLLSEQKKFNEIKNLLSQNGEGVYMSTLEKSAKSIAVSISYTNQRLFVYSMQEELKKMLAKVDREKKHRSMKEKLTNTLGCFGVFLFYIIKAIICILPFVMIGGNFFFTFLLLLINACVPFASVIFWVWGLVCAIKGVQDIWAVIYYIAFIVIWIPFYLSTIISFFKKD